MKNGKERKKQEKTQGVIRLMKGGMGVGVSRLDGRKGSGLFRAGTTAEPATQKGELRCAATGPWASQGTRLAGHHDAMRVELYAVYISKH